MSTLSEIPDSNVDAALLSDIKDDRTVKQTYSNSGSNPYMAVKDLEKISFLKPIFYVLNNGQVFHDKLLPDPVCSFPSDLKFSTDYYVNLHFKVASFQTYNHLGARISLNHSNINVNKFRELLPFNYDDKVILQFMEYGFPLGLKQDYMLKPVMKNHSSSY